MRYLIVLAILLVTTYSFAQQTVWYDAKTNFTIVDISGKKSEAQIMDEFKIRLSGDKLQTISIDESKENYRIVDGGLTKYDAQALNEQVKNATAQEKLQKEAEVKQALNITDSTWNALKEAIR